MTKQKQQFNSTKFFSSFILTDTISKVPGIPWQSILIIRTLPTSRMLRNWTGDRLDGLFTSWNSMSNWSTKQDQKWSNLMCCPKDRTWSLMWITIMKTWHCYQIIYFLNLLDITLQEHILKLGQVDDFLREFPPSDPPFGAPSDWKLELVDGLNTLFYRDRNYVPNNLTLWQDIVRMLHDHKTAGHPGKAEPFVAVERHYWWPGLRTFVWNYVKGCGICQQYKINRSPSHPSYMPIPPSSSTRPFASCSMDLITDLPLAWGFNSILVMVDCSLMKGVILLPCNKMITGTSSRTASRTSLQMIWTSRQIHLWQRTPICCTCFLGAIEASQCD